MDYIHQLLHKSIVKEASKIAFIKGLFIGLSIGILTIVLFEIL